MTLLWRTLLGGLLLVVLWGQTVILKQQKTLGEVSEMNLQGLIQHEANARRAFEEQHAEFHKFLFDPLSQPPDPEA